MNYKIAFIGFGVVGQGFAELLHKNNAALLNKYGCEFTVVSICDAMKGSIHNANGINIEELLTTVRNTGKVSNEKTDSLEMIRKTNADIIIEVSYTDIKTGQPALDHIRTALRLKKHVVTTNKGPIALAYHELISLAKENNVQLQFEGTVMSGTPVLNTIKYGLAGATIREVKGILNGTTNLILTEMENGKSYADALAHAQQLGYAEANPSGDVEGFDTLAKVLILSTVAFGQTLQPNEVLRNGITNISEADIDSAHAEGKRWKLIGSIKKTGDTISASVLPEKIPLSDPLAHVMGATNSITIISDELGATNITGAGAGKTETGIALLSDLIDIHRHTTNS